ncbi:hypothetical protein AN958_12881 [Leucoagaricus sp. SymC.cos]|nr:hypothetical protein AN958_12881 [Leucoagaricus sp. SymC.cos]
MLQRTGDVDLTKDGMAQTTMASVEVVRGLRGGLMGKLQLPLVRRKTVPANANAGGAGGGFTNGSAMIQGEDGDEVVGGGGGVGGEPEKSILGFTSHRKPPEYVPSGSVLVQVWAVGVDGVDGRLIGVSTEQDSSASQVTGVREEVEEQGDVGKPKPKGIGTGLGRSLSLRERITRSVSLGRSAGKERLQQRRRQQQEESSLQQPSSSTLSQSPETQEKYFGGGSTVMPGIGHIPGRSFVGRVVECGWEVRGEVARKGDWVAGLLDIKKCGALTEFIVVDRHRVHRVPHPKLSPNTDRALSALVFASPSSPASASPLAQHTLTLEELALIPLCGVPAYRAVRTFIYAFSSMRDNPSISSVGRSSDLAKHRPHGHDPNTPLNFATYGSMISRLNLGDHENGRRRRALVLSGHDGIGAMAVQMLVLRGWRVCVHVPFIATPPNVPTTAAIADGFMEEVEERIRKWGAEEVIFDDGEVIGMDEGRGAVVRVMNGLREDGDVFDAVLDTIGGKDVREAAERLLRSPGRRGNPDESMIGIGNGSGSGGRYGKPPAARRMGQFTTVVGDNPERAIPSAGDLFRAGIRSLKFGGGSSSENVSTRGNEGKGGKVGYAWINISQDVDWEGKDVGETIGSLVELALDYGIKPWGSEASHHWEGRRIIPFEKAPDVFVCGGPLKSGGTVVVRIAS